MCHKKYSSCFCTGNTYIIVSQAAFAWGVPTLLCHKLSLHGEHLHYCVISCLCTENTYIIVSQTAFPQEDLHYCVTSCLYMGKTYSIATSCLYMGNTYIIVSKHAFAQGTPTLLCHKLPLHREHLILLCHKLPLHREHLYNSVTNCIYTETTYIIVSQAAFAQ
jgi:hypothetical protein